MAGSVKAVDAAPSDPSESAQRIAEAMAERIAMAIMPDPLSSGHLTDWVKEAAGYLIVAMLAAEGPARLAPDFELVADTAGEIFARKAAEYVAMNRM